LKASIEENGERQGEALRDLKTTIQETQGDEGDWWKQGAEEE